MSYDSSSVAAPFQPLYDPQASTNEETLTESEVKHAIITFYRKESNFSSNAVEKMKILSITPMPSYRYILEVDVEKRQYLGRPVRPARVGETLPASEPLPDIWSVPFEVPTEFPHSEEQDFSKNLRVMECDECNGGYVLCERCGGAGGVASGANYFRYGVLHPVPCHYCQGSGKGYCPVCKGVGCNVAKTYLKVTWERETLTRNSYRGPLPHELLDDARYSDTEVIKTSKPPIKPIHFEEDPFIHEAAKETIKEVLANKSLRIFSARQSVVKVPVFEVHYKLNGQEGRLYVYGEDEKIMLPTGFIFNKTCCECVIL